MLQKDDFGKYHKDLAELRFAADTLEEEIGNLHHELRRIRDGMERVGGSSQELEQKAKQLLENIDLCKRDLRENKKQQSKVSKQLTE